MTTCAVIDFETRSLKLNAYLLSAGITSFELEQTNTWEELETNSWHIVFDNRGQDDRTSDYDTVSWWKEQPEKTFALATQGELTYPLQVGMFRLAEYIKQNKVEYLIGNGCTFDNMIFRHACREAQIDYPLPYWADLDLRSMKLLAGRPNIVFPKDKIPHYALHDAIFEAQCVQQYWAICNAPRL